MRHSMPSIGSRREAPFLAADAWLGVLPGRVSVRSDASNGSGSVEELAFLVGGFKRASASTARFQSRSD